jgi:hypothetical protein
MNTLKELVGNALESSMVRWTLALLALGAIPCYFLSMVKASLVG